jgi:purine-binding chemotaxis protein CheW
MSESLAASKQLMKTYLSELLTEEEVEKNKVLPVKENKAKPLEKLLASATFPQTIQQEETHTLRSAKAENKVESDTTATINKTVAKGNQAEATPDVALKKPIKTSIEIEENDLKTRKSNGGFTASKEHSYREGNFQAMFFDVAGLTIAVPLIELGGIHSNGKTTSLMGKPDWFKGVMLHRDVKVNVVDTARWVMPEKCDEALISGLNYQYIIMLNDSSWGLTAENLIDTVTLKQEDVKWLDTPNKRPWLAGLVKNRMCALLDVEALIKLLEKGVNITQE